MTWQRQSDYHQKEAAALSAENNYLLQLLKENGVKPSLHQRPSVLDAVQAGAMKRARDQLEVEKADLLSTE